MLRDLLENNKIKNKIKMIQKVYLSDNRPWVVGFSGGKDSTAVAQLVFQALHDLPEEERRKEVFIISSDTLIETPLIISSISKTLDNIELEAKKLNLPIKTFKVRPEIDKSFWTLLIGKGYPSPRQKFRWCTDRLKIEPANKFILDKVSEFGEVIMVLGVRDSESSTRAQVMESHSFEGKELMRHSSLNNAYVYAPIRDFDLDDVWNYLLDEPSPWGNNNKELLALYQNSQSSGECPLIVDKEIKESAGSCGNSRFGCWVCTVVVQDKALIGFIDNGQEWLRPLLKFRNWLSQIRDVRELREKRRMNGTIYFVKQQEDEKQLGLGPFTLEARKLILRELLKTQKSVENPHDINYKLILEEELKTIRKLWINDGDWDDSLPKIYREVMGHDLEWEVNERPMFQSNQINELENLCSENDLNFDLMKKLINIEMNYSGFKIRRGLLKELESTLNQDWLHYGKVEGFKE